jgi:hypothetical protein
MSDQEKKAVYFIQRLKLIEKERLHEKKTKMLEKREKNQKWQEGMEKDRTKAVKELKKKKY